MKCITFHNGVCTEGFLVSTSTRWDEKSQSKRISPVVILGATSRIYYQLAFNRNEPAIIDDGRVKDAFPSAVKRKGKDGKNDTEFFVLARPRDTRNNFGNILLRVLTSMPVELTQASRVSIISGEPKLIASGSGCEHGKTWVDQVYWMRSTPVNDTLEVSINGKKTILGMDGDTIQVMSPEVYKASIDALGGIEGQEAHEGEGGSSDMVPAEEMQAILEDGIPDEHV